MQKWEAKLDVKASAYFLQRMKTKWGSCSHRVGHIRLNEPKRLNGDKRLDSQHHFAKPPQRHILRNRIDHTVSSTQKFGLFLY